MAARLPEVVTGPGDLTIRRWTTRDADGLSQAIAESIEHLRPWMPWVAQEPMSLTDRTATIERREADWRAGGDLTAGVFLGSEIVGSCGLHRRIGPGGVEIGYWIHPAHTRQGIATTVARTLTDAAFSIVDISHVEIHHDQANEPSGRIPRRLGYQLIRQEPDQPTAPGEIGISCIWRTTRENWSRRSDLTWGSLTTQP